MCSLESYMEGEGREEGGSGRKTSQDIPLEFINYCSGRYLKILSLKVRGGVRKTQEKRSATCCCCCSAAPYPLSASINSLPIMEVLGASKFGRQNLRFFTHHPKPYCVSPTDVIIKVEHSDLNPVDHHKVRIVYRFPFELFQFNTTITCSVALFSSSIPNQKERQHRQIVLHLSLDSVDLVLLNRF